MTEASVGTRYQVEGRTVIWDKNDEIVVVHVRRDSPFLQDYDAWRIAYCNKHRHDKKRPWIRLREGKTDLFTLLYSLVIYFKEAKNGTGTETH